MKIDNLKCSQVLPEFNRCLASADSPHLSTDCKERSNIVFNNNWSWTVVTTKSFFPAPAFSDSIIKRLKQCCQSVQKLHPNSQASSKLKVFDRNEFTCEYIQNNQREMTATSSPSHRINQVAVIIVILVTGYTLAKLAGRKNQEKNH